MQEIVMREDEKIMDKAEEIVGCVDFKSKYVDFERDGAEFRRVIKECFRNGTVMTAGELCKKMMALEPDKRKENF